MTGFGKGEALFGNKKITVEIRSLNSKQLDLNLRLPGAYRQTEYELRNLISRAVQRGKVDVFVSVESQATETSARIDGEVLTAYAAQLREAAEAAGLDTRSAGWDAAALQCVMRLPDVVATQSTAVTDDECAVLVAAAREACDRLDAFRAQEGATLIADLLRFDLIESYKERSSPSSRPAPKPCAPASSTTFRSCASTSTPTASNRR